MACYDFPNNPSLGDTVTIGSRVFTWDGEKWIAGRSNMGNIDGGFAAAVFEPIADIDGGFA